jgi:hypothetical protein
LHFALHFVPLRKSLGYSLHPGSSPGQALRLALRAIGYDADVRFGILPLQAASAGTTGQLAINA